MHAGVVSVLFKYCDDNKMALLDLKDLKKVINYITEEAKDEIAENYGKISISTTGIIPRKIIELEQQGAELFFDEMSFDIKDLMRIDENRKGYANIIRLTHIQDKPKLFSRFILSLLAKIYYQMPEKGEVDQSELVVFIDEAHLIFNEASKTLLQQIETIVKLIHSIRSWLVFYNSKPYGYPQRRLGTSRIKNTTCCKSFYYK